MQISLIGLNKKVNTLENEVSTLRNQLELEKAKKELWMEKVIEQQQETIKLQGELLNGRTCRRDITKNENKGTHRGRPKKVCDDKGTTDRVCDEVQ